MVRAGVVTFVVGMVAVASAKPAPQPQPAGSDEAAAPADPADVDAQLPPHLTGPRKVDLGSGTELDLPAGMILYEAAQAREILRKAGDDPAGVLALVEPVDGTWGVSIDFDSVGYVEDSDADELDANQLLSQYKEGTAEQNEKRKAVGVKPLYVDAWSDPPRYQAAQHRLVWGLLCHTDDGKVINSFTRLLGRNGFLSFDLIDSPDSLEASKKAALPLLDGLRFKSGFRYEDHVSSDHSSGIGLRGLVLGGAGVAVASKLGILAKILLVLKKGIILIVAAIGGFFRWLFGRRKKDDVIVQTDAAPEPPEPPATPSDPPADPPSDPPPAA